MKHPGIAVLTALLWRKATRLERENKMSEPVGKVLRETRVL